ncbi:MAG: hypothetical protein ING52_13935 [Burkholderiales bacterium]|nr:hypothetical protein [Burkholderiales bacterium]
MLHHGGSLAEVIARLKTAGVPIIEGPLLRTGATGRVRLVVGAVWSSS